MSKEPNPVAVAIEAARNELDQCDSHDAEQSLPHLRAAHDHLTTAIDEAMAAAIVARGSTIRSAGQLAGLSENAVGPRLARTSLLAAYGVDTGRVTATGVERARYDLEQGRHKTVDTAGAADRKSMRFRARRNT